MEVYRVLVGLRSAACSSNVQRARTCHMQEAAMQRPWFRPLYRIVFRLCKFLSQ